MNLCFDFSLRLLFLRAVSSWDNLKFNFILAPTHLTSRICTAHCTTTLMLSCPVSRYVDLYLHLTYIYAWLLSTIGLYLCLTYIHTSPISTVIDVYLRLTSIYTWPLSRIDLYVFLTYIHAELLLHLTYVYWISLLEIFLHSLFRSIPVPPLSSSLYPSLSLSLSYLHLSTSQSPQSSIQFDRFQTFHLSQSLDISIPHPYTSWSLDISIPHPYTPRSLNISVPHPYTLDPSLLFYQFQLVEADSKFLLQVFFRTYYQPSDEHPDEAKVVNQLANKLMVRTSKHPEREILPVHMYVAW